MVAVVSAPYIGPWLATRGAHPFPHHTLFGHPEQLTPKASVTYRTSNLRTTNETSAHPSDLPPASLGSYLS